MSARETRTPSAHMSPKITHLDEELTRPTHIERPNERGRPQDLCGQPSQTGDISGLCGLGFADASC